MVLVLAYLKRPFCNGKERAKLKGDLVFQQSEFFQGFFETGGGDGLDQVGVAEFTVCLFDAFLTVDGGGHDDFRLPAFARLFFMFTEYT